jgi:regulator of cell morphogenesis and NO signaling
MYQTNRTYVTAEMKLADLIFENPSLLLMLEHFSLDFIVQDKTVKQLCQDNQINPLLFSAIANLYNGFSMEESMVYEKDDLQQIVQFLKTSHTYYRQDKYPEIQGYIKKLYAHNNSIEIKLVERFFDEYFTEVTEHLLYEEKNVYPYVKILMDSIVKGDKIGNKFSAHEYSNHHTDIESKLTDLKSLLLKHVSIKNDQTIRRKLLFSLFELEYDLMIHSLIEERILMPLIEQIENTYIDGR